MKVSICCFVAIISLVQTSPLNNRVVGGQNAVLGQFPYQVAITVNDRHHCGGSIIDQNWILTAAHCVYLLSPSDFTILVGTVSESSGGSKHQVSSMIVHEKWDSNKIYADIALLRTATPIQFNKNIQPITLATKNPPPGKQATLSGWGLTSYPEIVEPDIMQHIQLNIISLEECIEKMGMIYDNQVCTMNIKGEGSCRGDSGGPLVYNGEQVGVVSWGELCATGMPDVYTSVSAFREWVYSNIKN